MRMLLVAAALAACSSPGADDGQRAPAPAPTPVNRPATAGDAGPERAQYERLLDRLPSPCGAGESLRRSMRPSAHCPRARFAARYLEMQVAAGASDDVLTLVYENRYIYSVRGRFTLANAPHLGDPEAPVVLIELIDYLCRACRSLTPTIEEMAKKYAGQVVLFYKMMPLDVQHPGATAAATAALAAHRQGRFAALHRRLLTEPATGDPRALRAHAAAAGLDLARYDRDLAAAAAAVERDRAEADAAGADRAPTLYFNGRTFTDNISRRFLSHWIEEELAAISAAK